MSRVITRLADWRALRRSPDWMEHSVGFVPTLGALHAGHVSLLARAREENERVVMSVFVNPTQFNDPADLERYPHTPAADLKRARPYADAILAPAASEIYPDDYRYRLTEYSLSQRFEGAYRPGHFEGVLTVILKLLILVQPQRAYFGEKDWQQLCLIRGMAEALLLPVDIVGCPTVRDDCGLALSSRNRRLRGEARRRAAEFPRLLRNSPSATAAATALRDLGFAVDYVEDFEGMRLGAVRLKGVRLIDNVRL